MKHSIVLVFVSMTVDVLMASAQQPQQLPASGWTNPYFYYHYNAPLATAPQKPSPYQMTGNQNVFSGHDDHSLENTLGSHVVMLSTCLRELKTTRADLAQTTHRLDQTHTTVESVKNELKGNAQLLANVVTKVENMQKEIKVMSVASTNIDVEHVKNELKGNTQLLANVMTTVETMKKEMKDVEHVKNELKGNAQLLANVVTKNENMQREMNGNAQLLTNVVTKVENMQKEMNADAATSIGRMPKSCEDLKKIGHKKSGLYPVMGTKTVDNVYCDFTKSINDAGFQKVIGYFDVKTSPVYFHAQKSKSHTAGNTIVPFEILRLNVGNAMSASGLFVAPKSGKYFFTYSGISEGGSHARVDLQVKTDTADWTRVGQAFGHQGHQTFSLQATLDLAKGNQIRLLLVDGQIHDIDSRYTSFVGQLLDEEIVQ